MGQLRDPAFECRVTQCKQFEAAADYKVRSLLHGGYHTAASTKATCKAYNENPIRK